MRKFSFFKLFLIFKLFHRNLQLIGLSNENITNAETYNDLLTNRYGSIDVALNTSNLTTCDRTTFMSEVGHNQNIVLKISILEKLYLILI